MQWFSIKSTKTIDIQYEGSVEIYFMEIYHETTGTLNDAFLKWKDAITETENAKSSKVIVKL